MLMFFSDISFYKLNSSSADPHPHAVAVPPDRTGAAHGRNGLADFPAEKDQECVVNDPVFAGKFGAKRHFRFIRRFGHYITQTVGNAMHMRIHTDAVFSVSQRDDQVCRFSSDALDAQEIIQIVRYF